MTARIEAETMVTFLVPEDAIERGENPSDKGRLLISENSSIKRTNQKRRLISTTSSMKPEGFGIMGLKNGVWQDNILNLLINLLILLLPNYSK